jgi:Zn-finger nucleic acid-binding protein
MIYLSRGLPGYQCPACRGIWLSALDYWQWLHRSRPFEEEEPAEATAVHVEDILQVKICPADGHMMRRYRVSHDIPFTLDTCRTCNGVWFDQNEWHALQQHNLHRELNHIFSQPWQQRIIETERRQLFVKMYEERFGAEDYAEIQRIKQWLAEHPQGPILMAYLTDRDPYNTDARDSFAHKR